MITRYIVELRKCVLRSSGSVNAVYENVIHLMQRCQAHLWLGGNDRRKQTQPSAVPTPCKQHLQYHSNEDSDALHEHMALFHERGNCRKFVLIRTSKQA